MLHDAEKIWAKSELLQWYNDGYRELLATSRAVTRLHIIDVPPRHALTFTQEWEIRHTFQGPARKIFKGGQGATKQVTSLWETEHLEGVTPTISYSGKTQDWERTIGDQPDSHFRFVLPASHDTIKRVAWDHKRLFGVTVLDLDEFTNAWMRESGEPRYFTPGVGRFNSFEVYQIVTSYHQAYELVNAERGMPRFFSGSRTYDTATQFLYNDYAYSNGGDAEALNFNDSVFAPVLACTNTGGQGAYYSALTTLSIKPTYIWTITSVNHDRQVTQAWEAGDGTETGSQRGQFPWAGEHGSTVPPAQQQRVGDGIMDGVGYRFTIETTDGYHVTQKWEADSHNGVAVADFRTGGTVGTYGWEQFHGAGAISFGLGAMRGIVSTDRQYWPQGPNASFYQVGGIGRGFKSTDDSVEVTHIVVPVGQLNDSNVPDLIPAQMQRYLRFYTLARAFGRSGQGMKPELAQVYLALFANGQRIMRKLGNIQTEDRRMTREEIEFVDTSRLPRVRLPSVFPNVWG